MIEAALIDQISLEITGTPAPKGSARAFVTKAGKAVVVPGDSKVGADKMRAWEWAVRQTAALAVEGQTSPRFVGVPVYVTIRFLLARPGGHWGTGKRAGTIKPSAPCYPATRPDLDKLARSTLDALTGIVFDDDSRIVGLNVRKEWAIAGQEGARITVSRLDAKGKP